MLKAAISTKALAVAFALLGFQFVCFCCSWPILSLGVPPVDTTGRTANDYSPGERAAFSEYKGTLWEAPEDNYFGIVWKLDCAPGAVQADEGARQIGEWLCGSPLAAIFGEGGRLGLLPLLLIIGLLVAGVVLVGRLLLFRLLGGLWRLVRKPRLKKLPSLPKIKFPSQARLQEKYSKHAKDFGIEGNWSKANGERFAKSIEDFVERYKDTHIDGTFKGEPARFFLDPETKRMVMTRPDGSFWSLWRLNSEQC